jgi:hypothetical protein
MRFTRSRSVRPSSRQHAGKTTGRQSAQLFIIGDTVVAGMLADTTLEAQKFASRSPSPMRRYPSQTPLSRTIRANSAHGRDSGN